MEDGVPALPGEYNGTCLQPGNLVDSAHPDIRAKADEPCRGKESDIARAVAFFLLCQGCHPQ